MQILGHMEFLRLLSGKNGYAFLLLGDCGNSHGLLLHFLCHYDLPLF